MATIVGDSGNNTLTGNSGDDFIEGLEGNDTISGGDGNDYIRGGEGNDTIIGGAGNDTIQDYQGVNSLNGGDGDDLFYDVSNQIDPLGFDTITGGTGRDTYSFDTLFSSMALVPDLITDFATGAGGDILTITSPDITNFLTGFPADSSPFAEGYFRLLQSGADTLLQIDFDGPSGSADFATVLTLANTTATAFTADNFQSPYNYDPQVTGGISFNDDDSGNILPNSPGPDTLWGNGGDDTISGGDGNDFISGGDGDDFLSGDAGYDTLDGGPGNDTLLGGDKNDTFLGFVGADFVDGGDGSDTIVLTATSSDLNNAAYGQIVNVEQVTAADAPSAVLIDLHNQAGSFAIYGSNFDDTLIGTTSDDQLYGGAGADTMAGGQGDDRYMVDDAADQVIELPGEGSFDTVVSTISYTLPSNVENLFLVGPASIVTGNELSNDLEGGMENDTLVGLDGNDYLFGYYGDDLLIGGAGDDTLNGGVGDDTAQYSGNQADYALADNLDGTHTIQDLRAGSPDGTDLLYNDIEHVVFLGGGNVDFFLVGGPGNDTLSGGPANDSIDGGDGDDIISGGDGDDFLSGDAGYDTLDGGPGNDTLLGGDDNDTFLGFVGADFVDGGAGSDTIILTATSSDLNNAASGQIVNVEQVTAADAPSGVLIDLHNQAGWFAIYGSNFDDTLIGSNSDDYLGGGDGNDTLIGNGGYDQLYGGAGADTMAGGQNDDQYIVDDPGDQVIELPGEGSVDTVFTSISYTLPANVENMFLMGLGIVATGNELNNDIEGAGGNDTIVGLDGNDYLHGSDGDDLLIGGAGDDTLYGEDGDDTVEYSGNQTDYMVTDNPSGTHTIQDLRDGSPDGTDFLYNDIEHVVFLGGGSVDYDVGGDQYLVGGPGDDYLKGGPGNDVIDAGDGDDALFGNAGNDLLLGGAGYDYLDGGPGNDILIGGDGTNILRGGPGDDSYYFFDNFSDAVTEFPDEGTDTVETYAPSFTLPDNVENLKGGFDVEGPKDFVGIGNSLDNYLQGSYANDTLIGLDGNDTLYGNGGEDTLIGGLGDDLYLEFDNVSAIYERAGEGIDTIYTNVAGAYTLPDNVENLVYSAQSGDFTGTGNSLDNIIGGTGGADTLYGLAGNDILGGNDNSDVMDGGAGDDYIHGDDGYDTAIYTGAWSDYTISLNDFVFTIIDNREGSPDGTDTVIGVESFQFSDGSRTAEQLFDSPPTAVADVATALEAGGTNNATPGNDPTGNVLANDTDPDNNDTKTVRGVAAGSPTGPLAAGVGSAVSGSFGALVLNADGSYVYTLDNTNGTLEALNAGAYLSDIFTYTMQDAAGAVSTSTLTISINGADDAPLQPADNNPAANSVAEGAANGTLVGITASSTDVDGGALIYSLSDDAGGRFAINASTGIVSVANGALLDFETATSHEIVVYVSDGTLSSSQSFTIAVTNVGATINGTSGNDLIDATHTIAGQPLPTDEEDTINGGSGNDRISGLGGNDTINGGSGNDTIDGGSGNNQLLGGDGDDSLTSGSGDDTLNGGSGNDVLNAGDGNNSLTGGDGTDSLTSGSGNDALNGGSGNDTLTAGAGDDSLMGGDGNDILYGGPGRDILTGGVGADHFVYKPGDFAAGPAFDEITDFNHGQTDKIDLSAIDAINGGANNAFSFIGAGSFTGVAGQLHYVVNPGGGVTVAGDTNGDGVADFHISVDGVASLTAGDFML